MDGAARGRWWSRSGRAAAGSGTRPGCRARATRARPTPSSPVRISALAAWWVCLRPSISRRIRPSRRSGSGSLTGRLASTADTRLVTTPASSGPRTDTGTRLRTTIPRSARDVPSSRSRKPRVIAASTTSLIVPPWAARIRFSSARSTVVQAQRRRGPIGPLRKPAAGAARSRALIPRPWP